MQVEPGRQGPAPTVVASSPSLDGASVGVALDAPIRLRFDRFMQPDTLVRQSIRVTGGTLDPDGGASIAGNATFEPFYDVVERVVTYTLASGATWSPNTLYTVTLWSPNDPLRGADGFGFRALDGAPLAASVAFHFTTGTTLGKPLYVPPVMGACAQCVATNRGTCTTNDQCAAFGAASICTADGLCTLACTTKSDCGYGAPECLLPAGTCTPFPKTFVLGAQTFLSKGCLSGPCHNPSLDPSLPGPLMGLDLSSAAGIRDTAIGRPAHQTIVGPSSTAAPAGPPIFGVNMPLIDPSQPGNSYFMYKVIFGDADGAKPTLSWDDQDESSVKSPLAPPEPVEGVVKTSDEENARLRTFVSGQHMPIAFSLPGFRLSDAKALQGWIASGAPLEDTCKKIAVAPPAVSGPTMCNPLKGVDSCPMGQRCSLAVMASNVVAQCEPPTTMGTMGTLVSPGGACVRDALGTDNCALSSVCTTFGVPGADPKQVCRQVCRVDADCSSAKSCQAFSTDGFGVCLDDEQSCAAQTQPPALQ